MNFIEEVDDLTVTFSVPQNLSVENAYGLEMNFSTDAAEWININGNANFYRAITNGSFNEINLDRDTYTANVRLNARFTFGEYNTQLSGRYDAPERDTQGLRKAIYTIDLGVNRDVLDGNGTLTFSVRDLFNTRKYRGTNEGPNWFEESEFQWRQRQFNLAFTYRINQKKERERGNRDGYGGDDMDY